MGGIPALVQGRKEYQDDQLTTRLIGAAVLLAIAVIVLPFILDGSGTQYEYDFAEPMPPQPERQIAEISYSSRQPPPEKPKPPVQDFGTVDPLQMPQIVVADPVQGTPEPVVTAPVATSSGNTGNTKATVSPPDSSREAIPAGWNIQVASFVQEENAIKLYDKLAGQNLPVFINAVQGTKRLVYRVFVGPLFNQIDALDLQNSINRQYRVESIMVRRN